MNKKQILIFLIINIVVLSSKGLAELGGTLQSFEESSFCKKFRLRKSSERTIRGDKNICYENESDNFVRIMIDKREKITEQALGFTTSKSIGEIKNLDFLQSFLSEASRGGIEQKKFNELLDAALLRGEAEAIISDFRANISFAIFIPSQRFFVITISE